MDTLRKTFLLIAVLFAPLALAAPARADGCYTCGSGSADACKNYCRYREDTFAAHKECEKRGCRISGTGACPTAANYKVCLAPTPGKEAAETTVAAIPWCAPNPRS